MSTLLIYYWREFRSNILLGPNSFLTCDRQARQLSKTNESGLAEVVVMDGTNLIPMATYLRGTKRFQGKKSQDAAKYDLPPRD